jgi:hypothetical protein
VKLNNDKQLNLRCVVSDKTEETNDGEWEICGERGDKGGLKGSLQIIEISAYVCVHLDKVKLLGIREA